VFIVPRWFQSTCCKFILWDVITGDDTWRDEAVNRYQQQQQSAIITVDIVLSLRDWPWSMPWRRAKEAIRLRPIIVTDNNVGGG